MKKIAAIAYFCCFLSYSSIAATAATNSSPRVGHWTHWSHPQNTNNIRTALNANGITAIESPDNSVESFQKLLGSVDSVVIDTFGDRDTSSYQRSLTEFIKNGGVGIEMAIEGSQSYFPDLIKYKFIGKKNPGVALEMIKPASPILKGLNSAPLTGNLTYYFQTQESSIVSVLAADRAGLQPVIVSKNIGKGVFIGFGYTYDEYDDYHKRFADPMLVNATSLIPSCTIISDLEVDQKSVRVGESITVVSKIWNACDESQNLLFYLWLESSSGETTSLIRQNLMISLEGEQKIKNQLDWQVNSSIIPGPFKIGMRLIDSVSAKNLGLSYLDIEITP